MNRFRRLIFIFALATTYTTALAQFNESGISAGFFDSSNEKDINFSEFHICHLWQYYLRMRNQVLKYCRLKKPVNLQKPKSQNKNVTYSHISLVMPAIVMESATCGVIVLLDIVQQSINTKAQNRVIGISVSGWRFLLKTFWI